MDYFSIIKHLLISIIIILCLCTMPLNSNIDMCVKSNVSTCVFCTKLANCFEMLSIFERMHDMKRVLHKYDIIIITKINQCTA